MKIRIIGVLVIMLSLSTSCMMMSLMHTNSCMHNKHHNHKNDGIYNDLVCGAEININEAVSYNLFR